MEDPRDAARIQEMKLAQDRARTDALKIVMRQLDAAPKVRFPRRTHLLAGTSAHSVNMSLMAAEHYAKKERA